MCLLQAYHKSLKSASITAEYRFIPMTTLPCDEFSGITTQSFPNPEFLLFFSDNATSHQVQARRCQFGVQGVVRVGLRSRVSTGE